MKQDRAHFLANGMDDYITKPLTADTLADAIKRILPEGYCKSNTYPKDASIQKEKNEAVVDLAELREIMNANKSLLDKCIQTFKKNHGPALTRIMDSISADDGQELQKSAHRLKGMFNKYLAAKPAAETASRLEQMGAEANIRDTSPLTLQLQEACENIVDCLENISDRDGFS